MFRMRKHKNLNLNLELVFDGIEDFVISHALVRTSDESNFIGSLIVEPRKYINNWS